MLWVQRVRFTRDFYRKGEVRYAQGVDYAPNDEILSQVVAGNAVLVRMRVGPLAFLLHVLEKWSAERLYSEENRASLAARVERLR
jgi:hypothetical protein